MHIIYILNERKKISENNSAAAINADKIRIHITVRFLFSGRHTLISEQKQTAAVKNVHKVEAKSSEKPCAPQMISVITTPAAAVIPNGAARFSAFLAKLPRTMLKFGSNVSRNDGAPIISALMSKLNGLKRIVVGEKKEQCRKNKRKYRFYKKKRRRTLNIVYTSPAFVYTV